MPNFVLAGKQYEAFVTVLQGEAGGSVVYIDSHGHIHGPIPEGPEGTRLREVAEKFGPELERTLGAMAGALQHARATAS
jgi:hypothetical protein